MGLHWGRVDLIPYQAYSDVLTGQRETLNHLLRTLCSVLRRFKGQGSRVNPRVEVGEGQHFRRREGRRGQEKTIPSWLLHCLGEGMG